MKQKHLVPMMAFCVALGLCPGARAQEKPQVQVLTLVRNQMGDEAGAKAIEARAVDFEPGEDLLGSLKKAGANEAFLQAVRAAPQSKPASSADLNRALSQQQILELLSGDVPSSRVAMLVAERGINFKPTDDYLTTLEGAGAGPDLLDALRAAKPQLVSLGSVTEKNTQGSAADDARQEEVRQHLMKGLRFRKKQQFSEAEQEYRAATELEPKNPDVWVGLATLFNQEGKQDDAVEAAHRALKLNPGHDRAHVALGVALGTQGDRVSAAAEFRKAVSLNPDNGAAHDDLGLSLFRQGHTDEAIVEFHEALRVNPRDDNAHLNLGNALKKIGDLDGAIAQYRNAVRINSNNDLAHMNLGAALEQRGNLKLALENYRIATELKPENQAYRQAYEKLQQRLKE